MLCLNEALSIDGALVSLQGGLDGVVEVELLVITRRSIHGIVKICLLRVSAISSALHTTNGSRSLCRQDGGRRCVQVRTSTRTRTTRTTRPRSPISSLGCSRAKWTSPWGGHRRTRTRSSWAQGQVAAARKPGRTARRGAGCDRRDVRVPGLHEEGAVRPDHREPRSARDRVDDPRRARPAAHHPCCR